MSTVGSSGRGQRWDIRLQLAADRRQALLRGDWEPWLEDWKNLLNEKEEEGRKAVRIERHMVWVERMFASAECGAGMRGVVHKCWKTSSRMRSS